MKQNGRVNRIYFVFYLIGKPVYWLLLSPLLLYLFSKKTFEYSLRHIDIWSTSLVKLVPKKNNKKKKKKVHFKVYPWGLLIVILIAFSWITYEFYHRILKDLPTPQDLIAHQPLMTTKIYDRNRTLLYKIYKDENRSVVSLNQISQHVKDATIAIEDKEFYSHKGISLRAIVRVIKLALTQGKIQGGSTITQQLVKNTLLTRERTLTRKIREIILAIEVEMTMSKDQILEMYLNNVSYGGSVYGIEEAAQRYFHISAKDLDLAEASFLAALPAAPSIYSPLGPNPDLAFMRQREVLRRLVEDKKISPLEAEMARSKALSVAPDTTDIKAPHFVMYIRDLLARTYGEDMVSRGGLEVVTTLDYQLQQQVEKIVADEVRQLKALRVGNGAALVTNPQTGEILTMVGSSNYFDTKHDGQVNVTLRPRQPGSSIKPLMYSAALEHGFTPATIIDDTPVVYQSAGSPPYAPKNYDGVFHGPESLRTALASSHNVPAVKTEATIGLQTFIHKARSLGITTWIDTSRFGLSLTLGSGEVLMTDMATAYGAFANGGQRINLNPVLTVKKHTGETLYENTCAQENFNCQGNQVLDPRIAFQITSILSDNLARARAFGLNSVLNIPGQQVAVKTGTTNNLRDNWTIGYTSNRVVATWVGNNDNQPMSNVTSGITGASPIWNKIMRTQLVVDKPHAFSVPSNLETRAICTTTNRPTCDNSCQSKYTEYFLPGTTPSCSGTMTAKL